MHIIPLYTWNKRLHGMGLSWKNFINQPWAGGVTLLVCVIIAMLLANLPATGHLYHQFLETHLTAQIKSPDGSINWIFPKDMTVEKFINDILMVIFFFTVGLEIKREVICGELSSVKKALLPVIAAAGGMAMPALIYTIFNHGTITAGGWGIPTATDIAFAVGIMSILGNRVPVSLKIFLTALAIADDLGAILVVAIFYGGSIDLPLLCLALAIIAVVLIMNILGEKRLFLYLLPAIVVWFLFYYSGIHSTMSGVVMAFLIPMDARYKRPYFNRSLIKYRNKLNNPMTVSDEETFPNAYERHCLRRLSHISNNSIGMSYRLEYKLSPWVNFCIMPIFALANAGVVIPDVSFFNIFQSLPGIDGAGFVGMGIFFGLLLGKPLGITLASFIAIKLKVGAMPDNSTWKMMFAVACLGGIGFTMSIFVDTLSFGGLGAEVTETLRSSGKIAVLLGSLCSGILGSVLITMFHKLECKGK